IDLARGRRKPGGKPQDRRRDSSPAPDHGRQGQVADRAGQAAGHRDGDAAGRPGGLPGVDVSGHDGTDVRHLDRLRDHRRLRGARIPRVQGLQENHDDRHMILLALICLITAAIVMLVVGIHGALNEVPQQERSFQDPLPFGLRMMWPLVQAATYVIAPRLKAEELERSHRALQSAGQDYLVTPEQLSGLRMVSAGAMVATLLLFAALLDILSFGSVLFCVVVGLLLGWYYPSLWLSERRKARRKRVI